MSLMIGIVGKTNVGKSTFFKAATLVDVEISDRVFTTIKPNVGMGYVRATCPCKELRVVCEPKNSMCIDGTRLIPVRLMDVAGLVPDAHTGRGLGNQFLSDIMEADCLIQVVDASGGTDAEGNPVPAGTRDPAEDVRMLEDELDWFIFGILQKNWGGLCRTVEATKLKLEDVIFKQVSGLKMSKEDVITTINTTGLTAKSDEKQLFSFVRELRKLSKPMVIAANKADKPEGAEGAKQLKGAIPCSAQVELGLRLADQHGFIRYVPGGKTFEIVKPLNDHQKQFLEGAKKLLEQLGGTGVQQSLEAAAAKLNVVAVYPVENENRYASGKGHVLPDAFLVSAGTTPKELAGKIHTEFADRFLHAVDARTKRAVGADYWLKDGDVIKIALKK